MEQKNIKANKKSEVDKEHLKYVTELLEITTRMLNAFNLEKLLNKILETSLELLDGDTGSIMLIEEKSQTLKIKAARGLTKEIMEKENISIGEKISGWVAKEGKPLLLVGGLKGDSRFSHLDEKAEIKSSISVPLKVENRIIGVLNVNKIRPNHVFSETDLKMLSLLGNQAAISIWNVKLYEDAKEANKNLVSAQRQLIANEKMSALGQLSAGIAHEINNPLTAILGNVEYLMADMAEGSFGWDELKEIKEAARLCSRIIERLFNYCRPSRDGYEKVDISNIVEGIVKLVEHAFFRQQVKIILNLDFSLPSIMVNPDEIKEVFLNIMLNARTAMPNGGVLTITTRLTEAKDAIEMIFTDTGHGIPNNIIDKIFDPFFTTKRPGSAGLGLSICQRIVNNYNGTIDVKSEPGKGATFVVRLPVSE